MKEIYINYENDDIQVRFDQDDVREASAVLLAAFNGILHVLCEGDKELLYKSILETIKILQTEPKTNFPGLGDSEIKKEV